MRREEEEGDAHFFQNPEINAKATKKDMIDFQSQDLREYECEMSVESVAFLK